MLNAFDVPLSWRELLTRTVRETMHDNGLGLAAQLAFYFFLALFPALIFLLALASLMPLEDFTGQVTQMLAPVAPAAVIEIVRQQMLEIARGDSTGLLSLGLLGAIWSSSAAIVAVIGALNTAYDIEDSRPWWKVRLAAIALTIALAIFTVLSFVLIVAGPEIAEGIARRFGLGEAFVWTWAIIRWPIAFALVSTAIALLYYWAPDADQDWVWITPGSVVATLLWVVASLGFRYYVVNFGNYDAAYGTIGGIIVLLLWFYLSGFVVIVGAELNAEIEHASPWGKAPGEKVPGERRRIGPAAARAYHEQQERERLGNVGVAGDERSHGLGRGEPPSGPRTRPSALAWMLAALTVGLRWRNRRTL
jgi:membrane protein